MKNGLFITEDYLHTLLDRIEKLEKEKEKLKEELKSKDYSYQEFRYLDESNDILKEELEEIEKELEDYKSRIDKAIEYIENMPYAEIPDDDYENNHKMVEWNDSNLLNILKGEENESN